jgi:hypothetical protein
MIDMIDVRIAGIRRASMILKNINELKLSERARARLVKKSIAKLI